MTVRQLTQADYDSLVRYLQRDAQADAYGLEYRLAMTVDRERYELHIQPDKRRKVYLLRALRAGNGAPGQRPWEVADGIVSAALLELLIAHAQ